MSRWEKKFDKVVEDKIGLYNRALQRAIKAAITAAMKATPLSQVDSGNALYHWMVIANGIDRPLARKLGTLTDLRATYEGGVKARPVGYRRDSHKGRNAANRQNVTRHVAAREEKKIKGHISGSSPVRSFRFYHPLLVGNVASGIDLAKYREAAGVEAAGAAGVEAFHSAVERYMKQGQVRKRV